MYLNPVFVGVVGTLLIEIVLLIAIALWRDRK